MIATRTLLVLLCLLTVATSAHAECAWVLWLNPTNAPMGWRIAGASPAWYASKADCERTGTYQMAHTPRQPGDVMCLPQGIQPMGTPGNYEYGPWRGKR